MFLDQRESVADDRHHSQTKQIDLDDAEAFAVVLVPLDDVAVFH